MGEQIGMPNSRRVPAVAVGVSEPGVKTQDGAYRGLYYTAMERGILVFHAFVKKTQQTPPMEIELAKRRFKEILNA
jgi:phage-related protein